MLKITGIILVSGAISMYGAYLAEGIKKSRLARKELFEFTLHIKNCIDNGALPLDQIFSVFHGKILNKSGFIQELKIGGAGCFTKALATSRITLPSEIYDIYMGLFSGLGKSSFIKAESEKLARAVVAIEKAEEKFGISDASKIELYSKLGILCGLLAALLLI